MGLIIAIADGIWTIANVRDFQLHIRVI